MLTKFCMQVSHHTNRLSVKFHVDYSNSDKVMGIFVWHHILLHPAMVIAWENVPSNSALCQVQDTHKTSFDVTFSHYFNTHSCDKSISVAKQYTLRMYFSDIYVTDLGAKISKKREFEHRYDMKVRYNVLKLYSCMANSYFSVCYDHQLCIYVWFILM